MKLVRDNVATRHPQHQYSTATDDELPLLLKLKLMEEAGEVISARNRDELLEELADLLEVMKEVGALSDIHLVEIQQRAATKAHRLGGFHTGSVLVEYKAD